MYMCNFVSLHTQVAALGRFFGCRVAARASRRDDVGTRRATNRPTQPPAWRHRSRLLEGHPKWGSSRHAIPVQVPLAEYGKMKNMTHCYRQSSPFEILLNFFQSKLGGPTGGQALGRKKHALEGSGSSLLAHRS